MQNITIGRYETGESKPDLGLPGNPWSGWIEGVDNGGQPWILFLTENGRPAIFFNDRDERGAVVGKPILLYAEDCEGS